MTEIERRVQAALGSLGPTEDELRVKVESGRACPRDGWEAVHEVDH